MKAYVVRCEAVARGFAPQRIVMELGVFKEKGEAEEVARAGEMLFADVGAECRVEEVEVAVEAAG